MTILAIGRRGRIPRRRSLRPRCLPSARFLEISDADVERVRGLAGLFDSFLDGYVEQFFAHGPIR